LIRLAPAVQFGEEGLKRSTHRMNAPVDGEESLAQASLLAQLLALLDEEGAWRVSFSDLAGLARRVPDLLLPEPWRIHRCDFCVHAKGGATRRDCLKNKHAVNRLIVVRGSGLVGQCHLGLTDLVEPLVVGGRVLGAFYYGSVVVRGTEEEAERRIRRYCARRRVDVAPFLAQLEQAPRVEPEEVEPRREKLRTVARVAVRLAEAAGVPMDNDWPRRGGLPWTVTMSFPVTLRRAMEWIQQHSTEAVTLEGVAGVLHVNADHLGRLFRRHTQGTLGAYVNRVRMERAARLLRTGRYSVEEVSYRVGYADPSHFGKVFKRVMGCTPGQFATSGIA